MSFELTRGWLDLIDRSKGRVAAFRVPTVLMEALRDEQDEKVMALSRLPPMGWMPWRDLIEFGDPLPEMRYWGRWLIEEDQAATKVSVRYDTVGFLV